MCLVFFFKQKTAYDMRISDWSSDWCSSDLTKPERSIVFLNVTAEEKGLLGTEYYASSPLYPPGKTAAVLNMDALDPHGPARDLSTPASAKQDLPDALVSTAQRFALRLPPASSPADGYFFRPRHFPFANRRVPS